LDCRSYLVERCALPQYSTTSDCLGAS
jgi:hypothetical protein